MELKYPELRGELLNEIEYLSNILHDLHGFAENRREHQDDEDDTLVAAKCALEKAESLFWRCRDILVEGS